MTATLPKVLIVDDEYLVAMDAERIMSAALPCDISIATAEGMAEQLQNGAYDLIVFDLGAQTEPDPSEIAALRARSRRIAFSTTHDDFAQGFPGYEDVPVLLKPYDECRVRETFLNMMSR